jgi:hypothetical protein
MFYTKYLSSSPSMLDLRNMFSFSCHGNQHSALNIKFFETTLEELHARKIPVKLKQHWPCSFIRRCLKPTVKDA